VKLFNDLIINAAKEGSSDLHIAANQPFVYRRNGFIVTEKAVKMTHKEIDELLLEILTPHQLQMLMTRWSVDFAYTIQHVRIRVNVFATARGLSMAIRILPARIPSIAMLNLHPSLQKISEQETGLILICGPTGCGKSTTTAAIVEEINRLRPSHIVTLEDPIEFRFVSKQAFVEQRELGAHVHTYKQGLLDVLREDPDVIVVGEIRDPEEIRLTLSAAESGHQVIASLHAGKVEEAVYRLCNSFPPEAQNEIRLQVAATISWVIIQDLVYSPKLKFRVPHLSILRETPSVKSLIRENKLAQIENAMQAGKNEGMFTAERYVTEFLDKIETYSHPNQSFRATTDAPPDIDYASPLIKTGESQAMPPSRRRAADGVSVGTIPRPQAEAGEALAREIEPLEISVNDPQYVIDGNENLADLIAQMGRPEKKAEKKK
jgi:twitching motility protein PilT